MRLVAFLLITLSLVLGVIGAVTAYLPRLSLPDEQLVGLTLNDPAGISRADGRASPIATKGTAITSAMLAELRSAGVQRVRVKEFSLSRWTGWWMFLLGCTGLGLGAGIVRSRARAALREDAAVRHERSGGPDESLRSLSEQVASLVGRIAGASPADRLRLIVESVGESQKTTIPAFIAARPEIIARLGLGGYARVMDSFSAAERQINRAWSAAADEVEDESRACLGRAMELLDETARRLKPVA